MLITESFHAQLDDLLERIGIKLQLSPTQHQLAEDRYMAIADWPEIADSVFVPHTEAEYRRLVALLDGLIDKVGEEETHPLASLMEILGVLIEQYEAEHVPELTAEETR